MTKFLSFAFALSSADFGFVALNAFETPSFISVNNQVRQKMNNRLYLRGGQSEDMDQDEELVRAPSILPQGLSEMLGDITKKDKMQEEPVGKPRKTNEDKGDDEPQMFPVEELADMDPDDGPVDTHEILKRYRPGAANHTPNRTPSRSRTHGGDTRRFPRSLAPRAAPAAGTKCWRSGSGIPTPRRTCASFPSGASYRRLRCAGVPSCGWPEEPDPAALPRRHLHIAATTSAGPPKAGRPRRGCRRPAGPGPGATGSGPGDARRPAVALPRRFWAGGRSVCDRV